jgi:hypothetical protein
VELLFFDEWNFALTREIPFILASVYSMSINVPIERAQLKCKQWKRIRIHAKFVCGHCVDGGCSSEADWDSG